MEQGERMAVEWTTGIVMSVERIGAMPRARRWVVTLLKGRSIQGNGGLYLFRSQR